MEQSETKKLQCDIININIGKFKVKGNGMELKKDDNKLLISRIQDKIIFSESRNKIENSDFMDQSQRQLVEKYLRIQKYKNYLFYGGIEEAERNVLILFPDKLEEIIKNKQFDFNSILDAIRIEPPNEMYGQYAHRNYLGAIVKLGIKREKIGDIIVEDNGADIIISKEITKFLLNSLGELTRFSKSKISQINLQEIRKKVIYKEKFTITIPSMRLDNVISELAKCSRSKASDLILTERVFVNYELVTKVSKEVKENSIITIRGKGKFEIKEIAGSTRKNRIVLERSKMGKNQ